MYGWERQTALSVPALRLDGGPGSAACGAARGAGSSGAGSGTEVTLCFKGMRQGGITVAMAEVSVSLSAILQQHRRVRVQLRSFQCGEYVSYTSQVYWQVNGDAQACSVVEVAMNLLWLSNCHPCFVLVQKYLCGSLTWKQPVASEMRPALGRGLMSRGVSSSVLFFSISAGCRFPCLRALRTQWCWLWGLSCVMGLVNFSACASQTLQF